MPSSRSATIIPPRSRTDRWVAGVAGGIAHRLGVDPLYVRVAFVVFSVVGFAGYVLLLVLTIDSVVDTDIDRDEVPGHQRVALLLMTFGALLLSVEAGLTPGVMIPVALVLFGGAALWDRSSPGSRNRLNRLVAPDLDGSPTVGRAIGGAVLLVVGLSFLLPGTGLLQDAGKLVTGVAIAGLGALVIFGPWLYRMASALTGEREERIRSDTRAEVAAHLHDSVLQTLALIQRSADDPKKMVTLARSQERELRNWLYRGADGNGGDLQSALEDVVGRVERDHDVPIDLVVVGAAPVDERVDALIRAAREAMVNAAKHSRAGSLTVYAEVDDGVIDVWVTDEGIGFDVETARSSGVGIQGSIVGRMERHGGSATIISDPDDGTEIHLRLPLKEKVR